MNSILKNIALAATVAVAASSCNDVLDLNDTSTFGDVAVWSSQANADAYVTAAYKTFNDQSNVYVRERFYDNYSDIMKSPYWWVYPFNRALLDPSGISAGNASLFDCWGGAYSRIKRTNLLLNDLERYGQKWGNDWYKVRRAEARFCNAINYFFLVRVYGGVVLRTDHSGGGGWLDDGAYESDKHRARITEEETYDYIIKELQEAAADLPEAWPAEWTGRATKGIAYAFLSRVALYGQKWSIAASAAENCAKYYDLVPDYAKLFDCRSTQDNSKEIIFAIRGMKNVIKNGFDVDNRPFGDRSVYNAVCNAMAQPTAELADMYEFADGSTFSWDNYLEKHADPYTDREPRFHATVLFNGAQWEGRTIQTYSGGADASRDFSISAEPNGHTVTGYYLRKYLMEGNTSFPTEGSYNTDIVIRYAEVLLNKAEALAQDGNIPDALKALNKVRDRVNLPARETSNLDEFMTFLRHERCIELAGEGHRFFDLRRWRLAKEVLNGKNVHGHKAKKASDGTFTYSVVDADGGKTRIFPDHYYYMPLPSSEISQNNLCKDNPVW